MIKLFQDSLVNSPMNFVKLDIKGFENNKILLMNILNDKT